MTKSQEAKNILSLLQSGDERNRLLAFQLMESLDAFQEVAQAAGHKSLFHFLGVDNAKKNADAFFYTKGPYGETGKGFILYMLIYFWELKKQPIRSRRFLNAFDTLSKLIDFANPSPGYQNHNETLIDYKNNTFSLALSWIVKGEEKDALIQALKGFESGRDQELDTHYALRPNSQYPFKNWMQLGDRIEFHKYNYHYVFKPNKGSLFCFTFYINLSSRLKAEILEMLKSSKEKNRVEAFELMNRSLRREIGEISSEYTLFEYIDESTETFTFQSKVTLNNKETLKALLADLEQVIEPLAPNKNTLRKLFNQFVLILGDLAQFDSKPKHTIKLIYSTSQITTHFSWVVDDAQKSFWEVGLEKVAQINHQQGKIQPLIHRKINDPPDPDRRWKLLAHYFKNNTSAYQFTPLNMRNYTFSLKLQIDLPND
ncbi:MAG TPA: hypothetical protein DCS93_21280 [Microscillaceae bacterium]|nr:hypothetical protein [Microscillaceae bacterium]